MPGSYNRSVHSIRATLVVVILAAGCSRNIQSTDAVRQGVLDYLDQRKSQTGLDMKLMNVDVSNVTFQNNEATAVVSFKPKAGGAQGMSINYALERKGDKWVVKGRKEGGGSPHGAQGAPGAMPGNMPGAMPAGPDGGALPPGHPPTKSPSEQK